MEGLELESGHQLEAVREEDSEYDSKSDKPRETPGFNRAAFWCLYGCMILRTSKYVENDTQSSRDRRRCLHYLESQGNQEPNPVIDPWAVIWLNL